MILNFKHCVSFFYNSSHCVYSNYISQIKFLAVPLQCSFLEGKCRLLCNDLSIIDSALI